jgi:hypothetical protein
MKTILIKLLVISSVVGWMGCQQESATSNAAAEPEHAEEADHAHGPDTHTHDMKTPGPNGGRLIASVTPNFEFLVTDDRKVKLTFVDAEAKPIDVTGAVVSLTGGDRQAPVELSFSIEENALVSSGVLPDGELVPVILTIQATPESEPVMERFNVDFATCSECQLLEYACICNH